MCGHVSPLLRSSSHTIPYPGLMDQLIVRLSQIVQYTRLVAPDDPGDSPYFSTTDGGQYTWYSSYGFGMDMEAGHGTHTAGSAAGATLNDPAETVICSGTDELGCIGGCLNTSYVETLLSSTFHLADFPTWCPQFDCDGYGEDYEFCLSEDISTTLTENGGMAQGAKLSIFDTSLDGSAIWGSLAGKGMWTSTEGTGCLLHSNSWGADQYCTVDQEAILNDEYMYDVSAFVLCSFLLGSTAHDQLKCCRVCVACLGARCCSRPSRCLERCVR